MGRIRATTAKFLYKILEDVDNNSLDDNYHEFPFLASQLIETLGISVKVPSEFAWGDWGKLREKITKQLLLDYSTEELLKSFGFWAHTVFYHDKIQVIGKELLENLHIEIPAKVDFIETRTLVIVGF